MDGETWTPAISADPGRRPLDGLEVHHGQLIVQERALLVVPRDGQVPLRLDHQKTRRHAHTEPLLLRVQTLLRELAPQPRGLDALPILLGPRPLLRPRGDDG